MREILFRGKRIEDGEWVYGSLLIDYVTGKFFIHAIGNSVNDSDKVGEDGILNFVAFEVIPETVGQYTGLKDRNGKKIFEGDVHEYGGLHFTVKFGYYTDDDTHVEMYGWYLDSNSLEEQGSLGVDSEKYVNIIGNIHEEVQE